MLKFYEYTLPFRNAFKTGKGTYTVRSGVLVHFKDATSDLITEASPLPGFSGETLEDIKKACLSSKTSLQDFFQSDFSARDLRTFLGTLPNLPSLQFALSFLGAEILSVRENRSFQEILQRPISRKLKVNEVTAAGNGEHLRRVVSEGVQRGFDTFKIKAPFPFGDLPEQMEELSHRFPHIQFRLDANQTWPVEELGKLSARFKSLPIEYVEEPVAGITTENAAEIMEKSFLPIALDESVDSLSALESRLQSHPEITLIIKPAFFGNLFDLVETISRFSTLLSKVIITTSIESRVGRSMAASVASVIGSSSRAHGLNTGPLFKQDLLDDYAITDGVLEVPGSGLWLHSGDEINANLINSFC